MEILLTFLFIIVFLVLLVIGAYCVSEGGDILGQKYDATIIGGFVIAWLNTLPETIFFITALQTGAPNFAIGAISGSVITVCTIAVGACVLFGSNARKSHSVHLLPGVRQQALILGASIILPILVIIFGFKYILGIAGVTLYLSFILWTLFRKTFASPSSVEKEMAEAHPHNHEELEEEDEEEQSLLKGILYLIAGGLIIYFFSEPFINRVGELGSYFGLGPLALAFFLGPIASEAPEILESITLSRKGKTQNINIAFSNLVGGTISKTTLLTGLLCFYGNTNQYAWIAPAYTVSFVLVILCAGAIGAFGFAAEHPSLHGKLLIALFLFCCLAQFFTATMYPSTAPLFTSA